MLSKWLGRRDDPREISNADAAEAYRTNGAVFVDVREADEWAAGHMPGAVHIPLGDLARRVRELPKDREIITVCRSGGRSLKAVDILNAANMPGAKSMAGGMLEWTKQGRPVE